MLRLSGTMYFQYKNGNQIGYDMVAELEADEDGDTPFPYQLSRLESVDGDYRMVTCYLDSDYSVIDLAEFTGIADYPSWEIEEVDNLDEAATAKITKVSDTMYTMETSGGETSDIGIGPDGHPTSFADMDIVTFTPDLSGVVGCPTCAIVTGKVGASTIEQMTEDEIESMANSTETEDDNGRMLSEHRELSSYRYSYSNHGCLADWAKKAYNGPNQHVINAYCRSTSNTAFMGTKISSGKDIASDISGNWDNFKGGWNKVSDKRKRDKDVTQCTGHSLGGAIAKYNAIKGNCKEVVTFGAPKTKSFPRHVRLTQYINTQSRSDGCCKRSGWRRRCTRKGMYTKDPVTMVGMWRGNNYNIKYINGGHKASCWSTFAYAVAKVKLHEIDRYRQRI